MQQTIIFPWRDSGDGYRPRNMMFLKQYYEDNGFVVYLSDSTYTKFNRSNARNLGVANTDDEVVCVVDADCYMSIPHLKYAIEIAHDCDVLVKPFSYYRYLTNEETDALVVNGQQPKEDTWGYGFNGGAYITRRTSWEALGGFDERFTDWGGEDDVFNMLSERKYGARILTPGQGFDLWHPSVRWMSDDNRKIFQEYF